MDEIFLLSLEEYKKYYNVIPKYANLPTGECYWWLRTRGENWLRAMVVRGDGDVDMGGRVVDDESILIRPAIKVSGPGSHSLMAGDLWRERNYDWIYLGDGIAIAWYPVYIESFTPRKFDSQSSDYKNSAIRQALLDWYENRPVNNEWVIITDDPDSYPPLVERFAPMGAKLDQFLLISEKVLIRTVGGMVDVARLETSSCDDILWAGNRTGYTKEEVVAWMQIPEFRMETKDEDIEI